MGHSVGKSVCGAGALRPSPTWGPRAPDSEGPRAGPVPPGHTERRPHTPQLLEMVGVCGYKTHALSAFMSVECPPEHYGRNNQQCLRK